MSDVRHRSQDSLLARQMITWPLAILLSTACSKAAPPAPPPPRSAPPGTYRTYDAERDGIYRLEVVDSSAPHSAWTEIAEQGTAFAVGWNSRHDRLFVTAAHCLGDDTTRSHLRAGGASFGIEVLRVHPTLDLALISAHVPGDGYVRLNSKRRTINTAVQLIGYPASAASRQQLAADSSGVIQSTETQLLVSGWAERGFSGGPVLAADATCLGLMVELTNLEHDPPTVVCIPSPRIAEWLSTNGVLIP